MAPGFAPGEFETSDGIESQLEGVFDEAAAQESAQAVKTVEALVLRISKDTYYTHVANLDEIAARGLAADYRLDIRHGVKVGESYLAEILKGVESRLDDAQEQLPGAFYPQNWYAPLLAALPGALLGLFMGSLVLMDYATGATPYLGTSVLYGSLGAAGLTALGGAIHDLVNRAKFSVQEYLSDAGQAVAYRAPAERTFTTDKSIALSEALLLRDSKALKPYGDVVQPDMPDDVQELLSGACDQLGWNYDDHGMDARSWETLERLAEGKPVYTSVPEKKDTKFV